MLWNSHYDPPQTPTTRKIKMNKEHHLGPPEPPPQQLPSEPPLPYSCEPSELSESDEDTYRIIEIAEGTGDHAVLARKIMYLTIKLVELLGDAKTNH